MKRRPSRLDDKAIAIQQPLGDQITDGASERDTGNKIVGVLQKLAGQLRKRHQGRVLAEDQGERCALYLLVCRSRKRGSASWLATISA